MTVVLEVYVHDYNAGDCEQRVSDLRAALPGARVVGTSARQQLLRSIARLGRPSPGDRWPVALIDLQSTSRRWARGEHLIATIHEHPALRGKVVPVAFTRYADADRRPFLEAYGARGMLDPVVVREEPSTVRAELERLAAGDRRFRFIGRDTPPGERADLLERLTLLFPGLFESVPEGDRWPLAQETMSICRMASDGYSDVEIAQALGWRDSSPVEDLKARLTGSATLTSVRPGHSADGDFDLSAVSDHLFPYATDPEARWRLTADRQVLANPERIDWMRRRFEVLFAGGDVPDEDETWLPPRSVPIVQRFLRAYEEAAGTPRESHPDLRTRRRWADTASERVADDLRLAPDEVHHDVRHALLCLEDASIEDAGRD